VSKTRIVIGTTLGPCSSVGVQLKRPVFGSRVAPVGAFVPSEKVSVWPASASVAVAVKVRLIPSFTVLSPIGVRTGH
jgi:hypothetical protein